MPSLFSLFRRRAVPPPPASVPDLAMATLSLPAGTPPSPAQSLSRMLDRLRLYLPVPAPAVPAPGVSSVSVQQRPVGIGNWRGTERRGPLAEIALKGGRLDAVVRFQLWAATMEDADALIATLHGDILADTSQLWGEGFLRLELADTSTAEFIGGAVNAWRVTTDYRILYEYHYHDLDGAESIIARIPIHSDPEERDSAERETTLINDWLRRWDDLQAEPLEVAADVAGKVTIHGLASLAHRPPDWPGGMVTLARLQRNTSAPLTVYPSLADFLSAVTRKANPDLHAQTVFPSLADFLAAFTSAGDAFELGDWDEDGTPDSYEPGALTFDPPITLSNSNDLLRLSYQDTAFDSKAVVYLRASVGHP